MKKERKFRFVGDPKQWTTLNKGEVFSGNYRITPHSKTILEYKESYPLDWEEVDQELTWIFEPSNQDQPASSMTKFEKVVIDIIGNIYSNINIKTQTHTYQEISQIAINQAKETFKQLSEWQE